jgi:hypothetical protein
MATNKPRPAECLRRHAEAVKRFTRIADLAAELVSKIPPEHVRAVAAIRDQAVAGSETTRRLLPRSR